MKRKKNRSWQYWYVFPIAVLLLLACNKDKTERLQEVDDSQTLMLKELLVEGQAAPRVGFAYDANGFVTEMNVDAGEFLYQAEYKAGRLYKMVNVAFEENDTLYYFYSGSRVNRIDWVAVGNGKREEILFSYDQKGRLVETSWRKVGRANAFKQLQIYYDRQDNMIRCDELYDRGNGLLLERVYLYEQFDNKLNPVPNELLREYHSILLPQVRLQKNNPMRVSIFESDADFLIRYSFQYDGDRPGRREAESTQIRGGNASTTEIVQFTYY